MIKRVSINEINNIGREQNGKVRNDLQEFVASCMDAAEVSIKGYRHPKNAYASYLNAIHRDHLPVRVIMRKGRVFLIREDANA